MKSITQVPKSLSLGMQRFKVPPYGYSLVLVWWSSPFSLGTSGFLKYENTIYVGMGSFRISESNHPMEQ